MHNTQLWRPTKLAKEIGISPTTLDSAVQSGRIKSYPTVCGLKLVNRDDVEKWHRNKKARSARRAPSS